MEPHPRYLATWPQQSPDLAPRRESYRPQEIAELHGIGASTVYQAIYEGRLHSHRIGRAHVVPAAEVERWLRGLPAQ